MAAGALIALGKQTAARPRLSFARVLGETRGPCEFRAGLFERPELEEF
jgi:hypothetical protein